MAGKQNRLAGEKSPYLLEHSRNPVDWYPWGKEAFAKSKNDNKPIFLSIGYSTCHWCHRMEAESFEDDGTAAYINKNFIPVKVDREERPEVDAYYMRAVQAMTGGGGWPLSVFLTPDLKPFYGGTYFPPVPRLGMPSFMQVLEFVSRLWKEKREEVAGNSERVRGALAVTAAPHEAPLVGGALEDAYNDLLSSFDPEHGGFGTAPKFPLPGTLAFLMRYHHRTGKELALGCVLKTLDKMMEGGIRDHVGGGFHRYSTDRVWLVPHFEKMLYDNALLAKVYAEAYQLTKKPEYARVVRETLGWIVGEMKSPEGGFYSAQDADTSEGEGTYYTWTPGEVVETLGEVQGEAFNRAYGVTRTGNFEGRTILHLAGGAPSGPEALAMDGARSRLYQRRMGRPRPATDTKVLTSWNGLAISALAFAGRALGDPEYIEAAEAAARFVLDTNSKGGLLLRRYAGGEAALDGTLEDYAFVVQGLLDLFEADGAPRWLREATRLAGVMVERFEDPQAGGFFLAVSSEIPMQKGAYDGPTPSGNAAAILDLVRISELTGAQKQRETAEKALKSFWGDVESSPTAHTCSLVALDLLVNGTKEVVITAPDPGAAEEMLGVVYGSFNPERVVLLATRETYDELAAMSLLLEGRKPAGRARAYVCRSFACGLPAETPATLKEQLSAR